MIAYLTGSPIFQAQQVVVVTGGVGYLVHVGNTLLSQLSSQQAEQVSLHIYTHVKEDRLELYGFDRLEHLELFKLLIAISGVGPKTAQNLVDAGSERLIEAVRQAQTSFFTSVPRVGKKLAQKIIIELKSKLGSLQELNLSTLSPKAQDVMDALLGLGFDEQVIMQSMSALDVENLDLQVAIKTIIKMNSGK